MPKIDNTLRKKERLISLSSNIGLAKAISKKTNIPLADIELENFSDGEIHFRVKESVRGCYVYLIQSTCFPSTKHYLELFIALDALKRASVREITVIMPYYGYSRQDRKANSREPITAKLMADLLQTAGADRVVCLDLHAAQIQGFFNIPIDNFSAIPILSEEFSKLNTNDVVVVSPDHGGVVRALNFSKFIGVSSLAIIDKRRPRANVAEVFNIVGDVKGKIAIIVDDIIDTAGTLVAASKALVENGATKVYAVATHPVLSGNAYEKIENSNLEQVVVTDTIPLSKKSNKIRQISVAPLLSEAIIRLINQESVSGIFKAPNIKEWNLL